MSEFILQIENLLSALADPEYRYLALEPLITYGLFAGVGLLVAGFIAKARRLQVSALVVIGVATLAYFPYKDARLAAQPRMEKVYQHSSAARVSAFAENTKSWLSASWQFKMLLLATFSTLMIGIHRNKLGFGLSLATIALGLLATKQSMWLNYQDALAYHPNLKKHDAPIDRGTPAHSAPPRKHTPQRTPAIPVAQPVAPAGKSREPAKKPSSAAARPSPSQAQSPSPSTASNPGADERIDAPKLPFFKRKVEPLPRF